MVRTDPYGPPPGAGGQISAWLDAIAEGRLTRRGFVTRAAALGLSVSTIGTFLAACGGKTSGSSGGASFDKTKPQSIKVYNWSAYISPRSLKQFEQQQGIKIEYSTFGSNEGLLKAMDSGGTYDVIFPEEWALAVLIQQGKLQPLDMSLLPNFANVTDPVFQKPPYDPGTGGKKYSTVYFFGSEGIAVRLDKLPDPGDSWAILYDQRYKRKLSMLDGAREILGPALWLLGGDCNTTDPALLAKAKAKALAQRPLVTVYDSNTQLDRIVGGLPLVECWDGDAVAAMNKIGINKVRYVLPSEGYVVWGDAPSIPSSAASPYGAHLFLNFLMDPKVVAECANYTGYQPVIEAADPLIKSLVQRAMRPTPEQIAAGTFPKDLGNFNDAYQKAYQTIVDGK